MKSIRELIDLHGRTAVVTGGAGKIGQAFCEALAELGAGVCVLDIAASAASAFATRLQDEFGVPCFAVPCDITDEAATLEAARIIAETAGGLDILVNNAAYPQLDLPPDGRPLENQSVARWQANLDVMLTGTFLITRACVPMLRKSAHAAIINVASIYGLIGPDYGLYEGSEMGNPAYYAAAKGGIVQLNRYWATTLAPEIRVNCIVPGGVWRNQPEEFHERYKKRTPLGRMATEEDLKGAACFLAGDLSQYVTGQMVVVDGGFTAW